MLQYFFYKFGLFIINRVPRRWAYGFSRFVSDLQFRFSTKDRLAVINNLRQILQTKEDVSDQAREVFRNFGRYLVDFFLMYRTVTDKFVREKVAIIGRNNLEKALARGKGVIILTAHIGNWEMGAAVMAKIGHPIVAIALPHKEKRVNALFNRQRQNYGVTVVPTNFAIRRSVEALHQNQCVAVVGDRDFSNTGEPLPFLGRPTLIPKGAAFFALRTGAAIVPSYVVPVEDGRFVVYYEEPILPSDVPTGDEKARMIGLMKRFVASIERKIREYPTQWLMFREFGIEYEDLYPDTRVQRIAGSRSTR
jgi:KDO2-lipid IV(A) lauroyltransferase